MPAEANANCPGFARASPIRSLTDLAGRLAWITSMLGVWQAYLSNVVGQRVMNDLRLALYRHLQWMPLRFFTERNFTASLVAQFTSNFGYMGGFIVTPLLMERIFGFTVAAT